MSCLLDLPTCLLYAVPWWLWAILALIVVAIVWRLLGWKWVPALAAVGLVLLLGDRAAQQGYRQRRREEDDEERKADDVVVDEQRKARNDSDDTLEGKVKKWTGS